MVLLTFSGPSAWLKGNKWRDEYLKTQLKEKSSPVVYIVVKSLLPVMSIELSSGITCPIVTSLANLEVLGVTNLPLTCHLCLF